MATPAAPNNLDLVRGDDEVIVVEIPNTTLAGRTFKLYVAEVLGTPLFNVDSTPGPGTDEVTFTIPQVTTAGLPVQTGQPYVRGWLEIVETTGGQEHTLVTTPTRFLRTVRVS